MVAQLKIGTQSQVFMAPMKQCFKVCSPIRQTLVMKSGNRKFFVGGNWKANGSFQITKDLISKLNEGAKNIDNNTEVVIAPPHLYLQSVKDQLGPNFILGGQNSWVKGNGAFTGEITVEMLKDVGCQYVILGHSERRQLLKEDSSLVGEKCEYAAQNGIGVIACVGETLQERESGQLGKVLDEQLRALLSSVKDFSNFIIAYEPVWAIGTGKVATPQQAQEVHKFIREYMRDHISKEASSSLRIIYGGSVSGKNSAELAAQPDIDGFLVGGASLKGDDFLQICQSPQAVSA